MTLDSLTHGAQRHLQGLLDEDTRRLATILCLPLLDGVFATMLVSGSISAPSQIIAVALTIFAGAGALAVVFSMEGDKREVRVKVLKASTVLLTGAMLVAMVAPIYREIVVLSMMREVAAIALAVIAAKMLDISVAQKISVPVVVLTGLILSLRQPSNTAITFSYLVPAVSTALLASLVLLAATYINSDLMQLSVMRKGAAVVLVLIALSMTGIQTPSSLKVLMLCGSLIYSVDLSALGKTTLAGEKLAQTRA